MLFMTDDMTVKKYDVVVFINCMYGKGEKMKFNG